MKLINKTNLSNVESERKQVSNIPKYVYYSVNHFADQGNNVFTKSILVDSCIRFHTKPVSGFLGKTEKDLDDKIIELEGVNFLEKLDETKKPDLEKSDLFMYVPEDENPKSVRNITSYQLLPDTISNCLTNYGDNDLIEKSVVKTYLSPFKSREDRVEFKKDLVDYLNDNLESEDKHRVLEALIDNDDTIVKNVDDIEINKDWYLSDDLTIDMAVKRVKNLSNKDRGKKLVTLKNVVKNTYEDPNKMQLINIAKKIFNCHDRTAKSYADDVVDYYGKSKIVTLVDRCELNNDEKNLLVMIDEGIERDKAEYICKKQGKSIDMLDKLIVSETGPIIKSWVSNDKLLNN